VTESDNPGGGSPARAGRPLLSICIPAYNRAARLPELLDSVFAQDFDDFEVVICEDGSPERAAIAAAAARYAARYPGQVRYFENAENYGYDGNFRELVRRARGRYCFFMGNDDLVAPGAFGTVAGALARHGEIGVLLRTVAYFRGTPDRMYPVARYFPTERVFAPGYDTVVTCFRRLVSVSGIVLHRDEAHRHATTRFDGTLFYQLHLAAHILMRMRALYLPEVLAYMRKDGVPDFGASSSERGRWTPGSQPPETSVRMLQGHLDIAAHAEEVHGGDLRARIRRDLGNYMYPTFAHQAHLPARAFLRLYRDLLAMGFWRYPPVHAYAAAILLLGRARTDRIVDWVRARLGHTPLIGRQARALPAPAPSSTSAT
jgi:hypothetical protein